MFRKLRFFYLYSLAVIKKQWKLLTLCFVIILLIFTAVGVFAAKLGSSSQALARQTIKPVFREAVIGQPQTFNPLFSKLESEKEINALVFSGLTKIDSTGKIVPDLAVSIETKGESEYIFKLKKDITWHDGQKFTADDVIYTIGLVQNPTYDSVVADSFHDVEVAKIDDYTVSFKLKETFAPFLTTTTLGIIPKHIPLTDYRPVGTGPLRFIDINKDSITLEGASSKLKFLFYPTQDAAVTALKLGEVHSFVSSKNSLEKLSGWNNFKIAQPSQPFQLVATFFNVREEPIKQKNLRQALAYSISKEDLIKSSDSVKGKVASNSYADLKNLQENLKEKYSFNLDKANTLLNNEGWVLQGDKRVKDGKNLTLTITTLAEPEFEDTALKLKKSWEKLGIEVNIQAVSAMELRDQIVPNRSFQVLLSSLILNSDPDQYVLWHTTQTKETNISGVSSPKLDKLLEDGRKSLDPKVRSEKYQEFSRHLLDETPAIFLYYPNFAWIYSDRIKNLDLKNFQEPIDRFDQINDWVLERPII